MSEPKLISPMLDNFDMGESISDHHGIRCCPAMEKESDNKYIVKVVSIPASQVQLDALLLTGACPDQEAALAYFKELSDGVVEEAEILRQLSQLEGYLPYESWQVVPMEEDTGFDVYLLSTYRKTLEKHFQREAMTHLGAINLGLDLCAALAVCRRSGYLYVDLKPSNIYMTGDNEYRIGDLGFLKLDTLKFASLPDKYRSQYTAPEITDAFSALNTTLDIYAVGLILYQAYNDGRLPATEDEPLPPPAYADYEMAEIILKACAADPAERWQDPIEMGQAIVSYMQRNGANDTPIVPAPVEEAPEDPACEDTPEETGSSQEEIPVSEEISSEEVPSEDAEFLGISADETAPENEPDEIEYDEVSDEVSGILTYADELIAHPAPEPVIPPEPIDVQVPPLPEEAQEEVTDEVAESADSEETEEAAEDTNDMIEEEENTEEDDEEEAVEAKVRKISKGRVVRAILTCVLILGLLVGGYFFYRNYFLQPVSIQLQGSEGNLTVLVSSKIDENKLTVICADSYGNQLTAPVVNGKAQFVNLVPNSAYTVKVSIKGFHKLTGDTSGAYTTPVQTNISQFTAVTGPADGTVILNFTVDGPDSGQWNILYSTADEAEKSVTFSGHMITLSDLTVGKEYIFRLQPQAELYITGTEEITFTANTIVKAENLTITGCSNGTLSAKWNAPEGAVVNGWTVRCYNENGYDKTLSVTDSSVSFEGIDHSVGYTLEVTAAGMSVNERTFVSKNAVAINNFQTDATDPAKLILKWESSNAIPQDGWILLYTVDGSVSQKIICQTENSAEINPVIPGAAYVFTLQTADGSSVFNGTYNYSAPQPNSFAGYGITAAEIDHFVCKTPNKTNWDRFDLAASDYTSTFTVGQNVSLLLKSQKHSKITSEPVTTILVVRDSENKVLSCSANTETWDDMWNSRFCELDIAETPRTPGKYTVSIYFNGGFVKTVDFTVVSP